LKIYIISVSNAIIIHSK